MLSLVYSRCITVLLIHIELCVSLFVSCRLVLMLRAGDNDILFNPRVFYMTFQQHFPWSL